MNILFYRYGSIYEQDCIDAFKEFGITVVEEKREIEDKGISAAERVQIIADYVLDAAGRKDPFLFVFSINFYPAISDICNRLNVIYACWSVDCPVTELFARQIENKCNRVFLFDMAQYERISRYNPECVFYLPLGTNVDRIDRCIETITDADRKKFGADVSLVGSLYSEKNPLKKLKITDRARGYIDGIENAQMEIFGVNFIEDCMTDDVVKEIVGTDFSWDEGLWTEPIDKYVAAHGFIGYDIAEKERIRTLNYIAEDFNVDLYTLSDTSPLKGVKVKGQAKTFTEMPKIFNLSKINLNITMRPIQTGLSLRVFDVCGAGGFLITNYQAELASIYEIGKEVECYESLPDLKEKIRYYLEHEGPRKEIAYNGYVRTKEFHTVKNRIKTMFEYILGDNNA